MITFGQTLLLALVLSSGPSIGKASAQKRSKSAIGRAVIASVSGPHCRSENFLRAKRLAPEFIMFSDVNGPTKALLTHSIDVVFAAPASGAFTLGVFKIYLPSMMAFFLSVAPRLWVRMRSELGGRDALSLGRRRLPSAPGIRPHPDRSNFCRDDHANRDDAGHRDGLFTAGRALSVLLAEHVKS
jgi:hypothetical protein